MGLFDRMRNGMVGAAFRFGVEEGLNQVTKTRARHVPGGDREVVGARAEVGISGDVALPVGETALEDLLKEADKDEINGVSLAELRYLSGVPDPFGPVKFDPTGLDFGGLEELRAVRGDKGLLADADRRRSLVERALSATPEIDNRPRAYHQNPSPILDETDPELHQYRSSSRRSAR